VPCLAAGSMLIALVGCGGVPVPFSVGQSFAIAGTPPPPPPPPPPKPVEPPKPPPRVELRDNKIDFKEKIQFEVNKAIIKPESFSLLKEIADVIKKNPQVKHISIEGHASAEGDAKANKKLSDDRAKAVMKHKKSARIEISGHTDNVGNKKANKILSERRAQACRGYIIGKGIDAARLTAKGWGIEKPIADNATEEGREKNRRVEFLVIEQDVTQKKVEIDPTTGKEKVVEEKKESIKPPDEPPAPAKPPPGKPTPVTKPAPAKPEPKK